jgi:hypothetical protein
MVGKNQRSNLDLNVRQTLYVSESEDLKIPSAQGSELTSAQNSSVQLIPASVTSGNPARLFWESRYLTTNKSINDLLYRALGKMHVENEFL